MATAAGLLSPGLVSLVKRAQKLREEMDEQPTKLVAMDANSLPRKNGRHFQSFLCLFDWTPLKKERKASKI